MIIEYYLFVFLYMNFNDLLKKVFFNYFLILIIRQIVDGFNIQIYYFFILEIVILLDIIILYVRENL